MANRNPAGGPYAAGFTEETAEPLVPAAPGVWTFTVPARPDAAALGKRRCELTWGVNGAPIIAHGGDVVRLAVELEGELGPAGQDPAEWHVLAQLHGPRPDGSWSMPAVALQVVGGRLSLHGGDGHPAHQYTAAGSYEWDIPVGSWVDGRPYRVDLTVGVGNGTSGWITLTVDGKRLADRWVPRGQWAGAVNGHRPGTMAGAAFMDTGWCALRTGLYRGSLLGTPPTGYAQTVRARPLPGLGFVKLLR